MKLTIVYNNGKQIEVEKDKRSTGSRFIEGYKKFAEESENVQVLLHEGKEIWVRKV